MVAPPHPLRWREPLAAGLLYAAITLLSYGGSLAELGERLIGDGGDGLQYLWDAWWIERSLLAGRNPYFTDMVFAPDGSPLVWHSLVPLTASAIALLGKVFGLLLAHNLVVMAAFPLAGLGGFLLCRYVTRDTAGSLVGGLAFMLCPFLTSKTLGHLNLLLGGLLPFFVLALWAATAPDGGGRRARLGLAGASLAVVLTNIHTAIFAANVAFWTLLWRVRRAADRRAAVRRFGAAVAPALLATAPWVAVVLYYAVAYDWPPPVRRGWHFCPEPASFLLPFTRTSRWSETANAIFGEGLDLGQLELACYLGVLVFPLSLAGLALRRREPLARFAAFLLGLHLVLALGPVLLAGRQPVAIGGATVPLPFALWRQVPVLGAVYQSGRYLLIGYLAMALGLAWLVAALRERLGTPRARALAVALGAAVWLDYAFDPVLARLPEVPELAGRDGLVLDPDLGSSRTMYYQTRHGRRLVGGYLSRSPPFAVQRYRETPGIAWFFSEDAGPIDPAALVGGLREVGVENVLLRPDDPRGEVLARSGFRRHWEGRHIAVWAVPGVSASPPSPGEPGHVGR